MLIPVFTFVYGSFVSCMLSNLVRSLVPVIRVRWKYGWYFESETWRASEWAREDAAVQKMPLQWIWFIVWNFEYCTEWQTVNTKYISHLTFFFSFFSFSFSVFFLLGWHIYSQVRVFTSGVYINFDKDSQTENKDTIIVIFESLNVWCWR